MRSVAEATSRSYHQWQRVGSETLGCRRCGMRRVESTHSQSWHQETRWIATDGTVYPSVREAGYTPPCVPGLGYTRCKVAYCRENQSRRRMCDTHYRRWRRSGDPGPALNGIRDIVLSQTRIREDGCIEWTGSMFAQGYGRVDLNGKTYRAHRIVYELLCGPLPVGNDEASEIVPDHVCHTVDRSCPGGPACRHRRCVNPSHLEWVTTAENIARGRGFGPRNAKKTHCLRGHPLSGENLLIQPRGRGCRECQRVSSHNSYLRKLCAGCGAPRSSWDKGHELYVEGSPDCPDCNRADCDEEARWKRQLDR